MKYIARIHVLERHPDGTSRQYYTTRVVEDNMTVKELMSWRSGRVHDPINGEYASREIILTPDDGDAEL